MKYLDLKKLEYIDDIVEIDDDIADTILELNKKGYKTQNSCSGHSDTRIIKIENPPADRVLYEEDGIKYGAYPYRYNYVYVSFADGYSFNNIPKGFEYETKEEHYKRCMELFNSDKYDVRDAKIEDIVFGDSLTCRIEDEGLSKEELDKEIKKVNKVLLDWAISLEPNKDK